MCCQSASSASIPYRLCFIHWFLHSQGSAKNIRSREIFCDGLGLCNKDQRSAIFSSIEGQRGLHSEESSLTMADPELSFTSVYTNTSS